MSGLGFDCTTIPGFVGFEPPSCPSGQMAYSVSNTNECPVYGCMDSWNSFNSTTGIVTYNPMSSFMTINEINTVIADLQGYVQQGVTASSNNIQIVGAPSMDPQVEINYLQGLINKSGAGDSGVYGLNPYTVGQPVPAGNTMPSTAGQTNMVNMTDIINQIGPQGSMLATNGSAAGTTNTTNGTTSNKVVATSIISLFSGEPTIMIGNYDIGVYTGVAALAVVGLLFTMGKK